MRRVSIAVVFGVVACGGGPQTQVQTPAPPAGQTAHEVTEIAVDIPGPGITLEGVLAAPREGGPWPGVVLIHGSGPLGRDERLPGQLGVQFGFEIPVFEQLAHKLAGAGFAVVRYDKRTCTASHGCQNAYPEVVDLHLDDLVADAHAVLGWLRSHPAVDPARIYVVGHSQGGSFAPELMVDNPDVRASVMLAAPFRPIDQVSRYQTEHVERRLLLHNKHPAVIGVRLRQLEEISSGLRKLRAGTLRAPAIADAPIAYWQEWMALGDAVPALVDRLDRPLLALSGELDTNVPPAETELWRKAFELADPDAGHAARLIPCVTHALNCVSKDDSGRLRPERTVSPEVVSQILAFLRQRH